MSDWKEYKLYELVEITSSKRIMRSEYQEQGIPFFRSKEIIELNSGNDITTELFISKDKFLEINNKFGVPNYGDILLTSVGTLGVPYFVNYKKNFYFKDGNLTWFRKFNDLLRSKYLYYWFYSDVGKKSLKEITIGSTQAALTIAGLKSLAIKIPSLKEQDSIIEVLDNLSNKIQLNTQINQTLEQIAQAIFKSWFVDFNPVRAKAQALAEGKTHAEAEFEAMQAISGKTAEELTVLSQTEPERYAELAEIAKSFPSEFEEVDGVEVPKGWGVKRIEEVIQKIPVGKKYSSKTASTKGLIPILDQGRSGVIGYHNNEAGVKASIEKPVIVFANHTCYMRLISYDFSAIQNVFAFKGKETNIYWTYLATYGKQEFTEYKGHFPDFLIKEIIVPNSKLTELFGNIVKENFSKIAKNEQENVYLAEIRDLLLPRLLSGEV